MHIKEVFDVSQNREITSKTILSYIRETLSNNKTSFKTPYGVFKIGKIVLGIAYVTSQRYIQPKFRKAKK